MFILADVRSLYRTLGPALLRDIAVVCAADAVVGVSFGAIAVSAGQPAWVPVAMSLAVFAGGSQFAAIGIVLAGGSPLTAALAGLVLNTRHVPFGFTVADAIGDRLPLRALGAHLMIDESVAFTIAQPERARRRATYWTVGLALFAIWNTAVLVGALAGRLIGDPSVLGLDAGAPVVLLALVLPSLAEDRGTRRAALAGAAIALAASPFLPAGIPVALALAGLAFAGRLDVAAGRPS